MHLKMHAANSNLRIMNNRYFVKTIVLKSNLYEAEQLVIVRNLETKLNKCTFISVALYKQPSECVHIDSIVLDDEELFDMYRLKYSGYSNDFIEERAYVEDLVYTD